MTAQTFIGDEKGNSRLKFIVILTCTENRQGGERKELKRLEFEAPSITAAKARATKEANRTVFLEETQSWDGETKTTLGKDLRWKSWSNPPSCYTQENGTEVAYSARSASFFGLYSHANYSSSTYYAGVTLYWEIQD